MSSCVTTIYLVTILFVVHGRINHSGLVQVDQSRKNFLEVEEKLWRATLNLRYKGAKRGEDLEVSLVRKYKEFCDQMEKKMPHGPDHSLKIMDNIGAYAYVDSDLRGIDALYETFRSFQMNQTKEIMQSNKQEWIDMSRTISDYPKNNINATMDRIHSNIKKRNLFSMTKKVLDDRHCNFELSSQQVLYNLYNFIALIELKGYIMIQFSYMLKHIFGEGNIIEKAQTAKDHFNKLTTDMVNFVLPTMKESSRELWMCDPNKHIEGETYVEVTKLLQGYIENEVDLNSKGTCSEDCSEYYYTKSHKCTEGTYCKKQKRCHGKVYDCKFIDSDMLVCPSIEPKRRYQYVRYDNGRHLGHRQTCRSSTIRAESWKSWLVWHCSYCLCLCDEHGMYSDRYINLRVSMANIDDNRVITGVRFTKHNRIIHLNIQEGKLLPHGIIDNMTVQWVPVEDYRITDKKVYETQDFHTLTWKERSIDLDDVVADNGYVVTGVRFKMIGSHLNFEILVTPFDFQTGLLIDPRKRSLYKDNVNADTSSSRIKLKLPNPDISTHSSLPSIPDSTDGQYVEFTNTDIDRDAAQTTIPFFDAQKVESLQPVPLSGVGIFHKGRTYFGGFITPKIITYDFSKHLDPAFPQEAPKIN